MPVYSSLTLNREKLIGTFYKDITRIGSVSGEVIYDTPGIYNFTVPDNVFDISILTIGGGGGSGYAEGVGWYGGGGGGLGYKALEVFPRQTIQLQVGRGGLPRQNGEDSWFASPSFVSGRGGTQSFVIDNGFLYKDNTYSQSSIYQSNSANLGTWQSLNAIDSTTYGNHPDLPSNQFVGAATSNDSPGPWIQTDLGSPRPVRRIVIGAFNEYLTYLPQNSQLQYSNDGVNWTNLSFTPNMGNYQDRIWDLTLGAGGLTVRYLRIQSTIAQFLFVSCFRVYSDIASAPLPLGGGFVGDGGGNGGQGGVSTSNFDVGGGGAGGYLGTGGTGASITTTPGASIGSPGAGGGSAGGAITTIQSITYLGGTYQFAGYGGGGTGIWGFGFNGVSSTTTRTQLGGSNGNSVTISIPAGAKYGGGAGGARRTTTPTVTSHRVGAPGGDGVVVIVYGELTLGGLFTQKTKRKYPFNVHPYGEQTFLTVGSFLSGFIAPPGVYKVSAVAVGGGGGGARQTTSYSYYGGGGSGGGLGWRNNIDVFPRRGYYVLVGGGGINVAAGGPSQFLGEDSSKNCQGSAGQRGGTVNTTIYGGSYVGDGGGQGGSARTTNKVTTYGAAHGGAGGAGGYSGKGGDGGGWVTRVAYTPTQGSGGGGGGGGGIGATNIRSGGGGGVGLLGIGSNGAAGVNSTTNAIGGGGGSGGSAGGASNQGGSGGLYGGGGGGRRSTSTDTGDGGQGAVRVIWGPRTRYPDYAVLSEINFDNIPLAAIPGIDTGVSPEVIFASTGEASYTEPGVYSWVAPQGVNSVCVVCVGGGGGRSGAGGGGGGLGWRNNILVSPGQQYTVVVGTSGVGVTPGGATFFINSSTVQGTGGQPSIGGTFTGTGGGNGGTGGSGTYPGGGGAGGYSGSGGNGAPGNSTSDAIGTAGTGGGGGGGGGYFGGGGGGVGLFGEGANGVAGDGSVSDSAINGGGGGSGGRAGGRYGQPDLSSGGLYGGGQGVNSGRAASGALRIIWGKNRAFPSTNTQPISLPGTVITYSLGTGGTGGTSSVNGSNGSSTAVTYRGITYTANGGQGGIWNTGVAATGGTTSGNFIDAAATGGTGAGSSGDDGGGGGGGINGAAGLGSDGTAGGSGAQSINIQGLQEVIQALGESWTAPGAGSPGGSSGTQNANNGGNATGFGCGGGGAGYFGGNGGSGRLGGGGGGAAGYSANQTGGQGGSGCVVIEFINGFVPRVLLTTGTSYTVPSGTTGIRIWLIGGGGGGAGASASDGNAGGGGGAGGIVYATF